MVVPGPGRTGVEEASPCRRPTGGLPADTSGVAWRAAALLRSPRSPAPPSRDDPRPALPPLDPATLGVGKSGIDIPGESVGALKGRRNGNRGQNELSPAIYSEADGNDGSSWGVRSLEMPFAEHSRRQVASIQG